MTDPKYIGPTGAPAAPLFTDDGSFGGQVYNVQPEGFSLRMADRDRSMFNQMLSLNQLALQVGAITTETMQKIADSAGQLHEVTTSRFFEIMLGYGAHYKQLWDTYVSNPQPA